jgi:hypothetical protein
MQVVISRESHRFLVARGRCDRRTLLRTSNAFTYDESSQLLLFRIFQCVCPSGQAVDIGP